MWQPRGFGIAIGWLSAVALIVHFAQSDLVQAGLFGESCRLYGLGSWSCGVLPNLAVWLPDTFVYFLSLPLTYDGSQDWIGASYAMMWTGSPVAYTFALIGANYWIWKLNRI